MSYDCSGLGVAIAVRHLVCVVVGAPGTTWHGAAAAGEYGTIDAAPSNAVATELEKYAANLLYLVMRTLPQERAIPHPALNLQSIIWQVDSSQFRTAALKRE